MNYNSYQRLMKNKYALSTVITTLIILVVSILLASVLTYFAVNVVSTRVQEESLHVSKPHLWVDSNDNAEAAIMVTNNGGRDVVMDKIAVRGQESDWTDVFYSVVDIDTDDLSLDLAHVTSPVAAGNDLGPADPARQATKDLILPSGSTIVIYVNDPDSISINDIGLTVSIAIHSAQAVYYCEVNIQAHIVEP
jgi:hypothetical protein